MILDESTSTRGDPLFANHAYLHDVNKSLKVIKAYNLGLWRDAIDEVFVTNCELKTWWLSELRSGLVHTCGSCEFNKEKASKSHIGIEEIVGIESGLPTLI